MVNTAKTFILLAGLISILLVGGQLVGGTAGPDVRRIDRPHHGVRLVLVLRHDGDARLRRRIVTAAEAPDL